MSTPPTDAELRAALRRVARYHYAPEFGWYCWCRADRRDALAPHDNNCEEARALLGEPPPWNVAP